MGESIFIKGADISTIFEEEENGAIFYDKDDRPEDALTILKRYGFDSVRIRLWNDPYSEKGEKYGAGTNDLESTLKLAKRTKDAGMSILYDFHYSDFWADPGKQTMPKAWRGLGVSELVDKVYEYTKEVMQALKDNNTLPEYVQVGNELTNGLMWPVGKKPDSHDKADIGYGNGYDNIARFISAGIKAVREISPSSKIVLHLDNGGNNPMYRDWFDNYMGRMSPKTYEESGSFMAREDLQVCGPIGFSDAENFDIIGMSYYPFWHGTLEELSYNMKDMADRYGKPIVIAEVSMGYTMEDYGRYEKLEPGERKGMATRKELCEKLEYPMTQQGQSDFMQDFMNRVKAVKGGCGFYYWEPAWIPVPNVGWATEAALKYTGEKGPGGNEWANQALFDYEGHALPALDTIRDFM